MEFYDPDTLFGCFPVEDVIYEHSFRVNGIDSIENKIKKAELSSLNVEQRAALITRRDTALGFVKMLSERFSFTIYTGESDKYGRILCRVVVKLGDGSDFDLAEQLIKRNLAFPYAGDKKMSLEEQANFCIKTTANTDLGAQIC